MVGTNAPMHTCVGVSRLYWKRRRAQCTQADPVRTTLKNTLRELMQKAVKNDPNIKQIKAQLSGFCPYCGTDGNQLHSARVGKSASDAIDAVLDEHPGVYDIFRLNALVQSKHQTMLITPQAVCCSKCNRLFESPEGQNSAGTCMTVGLVSHRSVVPAVGGEYDSEWRQKWQLDGLLSTPQLHPPDLDELD